MLRLIVDEQRPFDPLDRTDLAGYDIVDIDVAGQLGCGLDERCLITEEPIAIEILGIGDGHGAGSPVGHR